MSKPTNSAARNRMSEFERQCYDWGWADSEERIIKLLQYQISWLLDQNTFEKTAEAEVWIKATKLVSKENVNE